ncbi:hypothetical protein [Akkermansia sp. BCRC 18949]|uniref:hypothetical protein n=1 Tax=Akkermansia sp. BCRC 18949 TaxID=3037987 RepID=UPI00384D1676
MRKETEKCINTHFFLSDEGKSENPVFLMRPVFGIWPPMPENLPEIIKTGAYTITAFHLFAAALEQSHDEIFHRAFRVHCVSPILAMQSCTGETDSRASRNALSNSKAYNLFIMN